jgi:hypothetical protein
VVDKDKPRYDIGSLFEGLNKPEPERPELPGQPSEGALTQKNAVEWNGPRETVSILSHGGVDVADGLRKTGVVYETTDSLHSESVKTLAWLQDGKLVVTQATVLTKKAHMVLAELRGAGGETTKVLITRKNSAAGRMYYDFEYQLATAGFGTPPYRRRRVR